MVHDPSSLEESAAIRAEATSILQLTKIEERLALYGEVNLLGSYAYDVMVSRDIDFHIIVKEFTTDLVKNFFDYAVDANLFEYISFHDKHHFNKQAAARYASKWALDTYYFALRMQYNEHEWQIGVNFITKPQEAAVEVTRLFDHVTENQRKQILYFKTEMQRQNIKVSSAFIYRAVIEKDIHDLDGLREYLSSIGYSF